MTQRLARALMVLAPLVAVATVLSCRGGAATPPPPPPPAISVAVSPSSAAVQTETGLHFTAKVSNSASQNVTWEVNGKAGGDATVGMISSTGLYTAPPTVTDPPTLHDKFVYLVIGDIEPYLFFQRGAT